MFADDKRWNCRRCIPGLFGAAVLLVTLLATPCSAADRGFSVWDSISMARFSDPYTREAGSQAKASPDGRHFAVVTSRGLRSNEIESSIWIWEADQVRAFLARPKTARVPRPWLLARLSAVPKVIFEDSYTSTVTELRWSPDSRFLYCLAQNRRGEKQLSRVRYPDGAVRQLSPAGYSVASFAVRRSEVVYTASQTGDEAIDKYFRGLALGAGASALTNLPISIGDILFPQNRVNYRFYFTWVRRHGYVHRIDASGPAIDDYRPHPFALSPDGRFLVELLPVKHVPADWDRFSLPGTSERIRAGDPNLVSPFNMDHLTQYSILDLKTGSMRPLVDGPSTSTLGSADAFRAIWSRDSHRILITGTYLRPEISGGSGRNPSIGSCAAAVVDLRSQGVQCVAPSRYHPTRRPDESGVSAELLNARFGNNGRDVVLFFQENDRIQIATYRYRNGQWRPDSERTVPLGRLSGREDDQGPERTLSLWVSQSLNRPPTLWATDPTTGMSQEIWDPNPQLRKVKRGEVSIFRWKDTSGYEWTGGLIKPVGYIAGHRYPLVIQTHGFQPDEFLSDGSYTTAMAALPLASAGMMVLQIPDRRDHSGTDREATDHALAFEAAIDKLAAEGMIDPSRVGLSGFSRTCYYVLSALVRDPGRYAAAVVADGVDGGYMEHRLFEANMGTWDVGIYGGPPNGRGLEKWVVAAPDFHLDRLAAPLSIEAIGPASLLGEWELYSSLREQNKPVDLIYIPNGQHILQKPLSRLVSQQGVVDWFRFWMTNQMCSASEVPPRDRRWLAMRGLARKGNVGSCAEADASKIGNDE